MKLTPSTCGSVRNPKYLTPFTFKPWVFPEGFTLIVDTRENQSPLFLDRPPKGLTVVRDTLKNGDYGLRNFPNFAIERKYEGDLFGYCSSEMDAKTYPKMDRFRAMIDVGGWVGLVIECRMSDIFKWQEHTSISPECVRGALTKFSVKYGVQIFFANTRECASRIILDHALRYYNLQYEL